MPSFPLLEEELLRSIHFFQDFTNFDPTSAGYGLTVDSTRSTRMCSIASVGYALTGWVIAAERGWLPKAQAQQIVRGTLYTLLHNAAHFHGFFAHFLEMDSAARYKTCEYSTIDTAICLNGVITAAAYFGGDEIDSMARELLERVDWNYFVFEQGDKTLFHMSYNPDRRGAYVTGKPGLIAQWDMAAEQKMMYLQAALTLEPALARRLYAGFSRDMGSYKGEPVIITPGGGLYMFQCAEAWLNACRYRDQDGVNWFHNARLMTLAQRDFCIEHSAKYRTYHDRSWGLSSGDSPRGYAVFGSQPCLHTPRHNGTVSIWGALASLPFCPDEVLEMADYLHQQHPQAWGEYGFVDAYNLDTRPGWYSSHTYGIDKGCSMIMIENFLSGLVWDVYTSSPQIQQALAVLGWRLPAGA